MNYGAALSSLLTKIKRHIQKKIFDVIVSAMSIKRHVNCRCDRATLDLFESALILDKRFSMQKMKKKMWNDLFEKAV